MEATGAPLAVERRANFPFTVQRRLLQDFDYKTKDTGIFLIPSKGVSQTLPRFFPKWKHEFMF